MKQILVGIFSLIILFASNPVEAGDRWSLEVRSSIASATQDLGDADLKKGTGLEGSVAYRLAQHVSAYLGWGWTHFSADQSFAGTDVDFEETGYRFGMEYNHPLGNSKSNYMIQAGGIYNHIETENAKRDITGDSGHGFGWQVGAGLGIPLGDRWHLRPSLRYSSLSREIDIHGNKTAVDLTYLSAGIGLSLSL
ncbi:porin family protein [bacterium]|nr:porin family protein [bacterium]